MYLKNTRFNHEEEELHKAFHIKDDILIRCRERIFFASILGYLMCHELYSSRDEAPRELKTLTGDLERTLDLITEQKEYDLTLLNFFQYNRLVMSAVMEYHELHSKDKKEEENNEDELKRHISKLVRKMIEKRRGADKEDKGINSDLELEDMFNRIEKVKQSNNSFNKYMRLMGFEGYDYSDVDDLLKKTLSDQ